MVRWWLPLTVSMDRRSSRVSQAQLAGDAPEAAAAQLRDEVLWAAPEGLEEAAVLVGVGRARQLAVGLLRLALVAARPEKLEDLVLWDLHAAGVPTGRSRQSPTSARRAAWRRRRCPRCP